MKLRQIIKTTAARLEAVRRRETWALTPGEQARLAARTAQSLSSNDKRAERGDQGRDAIWESAEARYRRELAAAQAAAERVEAEKAAAKTAKKSGGWW